MARNKRKNHSSEFKSKVAFEALKGDQTLAELAEKYQVHSTQISQWKTELKNGLSSVFDKKGPKKTAASHQREIDELHKKVGKLSMELDWLEKKSKELGL